MGVVNLERDQAWLFSKEEFLNPLNSTKKYVISISMLIRLPPSPGRHERDFERYGIERRVPELLGVAPFFHSPNQ